MGLFRRKDSMPAPYEPSTGHDGDDQLLGIIAAVPGGFEQQREWIHYLYCADDAGAAELERQAAEAGWSVSRTNTDPGIVASREDRPVSPETVIAARAFFEELVARVPGGEYDGWEAAAS